MIYQHSMCHILFCFIRAAGRGFVCFHAHCSAVVGIAAARPLPAQGTSILFLGKYRRNFYRV